MVQAALYVAASKRRDEIRQMADVEWQRQVMLIAQEHNVPEGVDATFLPSGDKLVLEWTTEEQSADENLLTLVEG